MRRALDWERRSGGLLGCFCGEVAGWRGGRGSEEARKNSFERYLGTYVCMYVHTYTVYCTFSRSNILGKVLMRSF